MKFTLSWLKKYLETDAGLNEIAKRLTDIGLEVEEVTNPADSLAEFKVAQILEVESHPDADKLKVCKVDDGKQQLQIICGAPNARAGLKVVLAPIDSVIPTNKMKIKKAKIRGIESNGMLCSAAELGLGEDTAGVIELSEDAKVGESYIKSAGLDDPVIEIAITPNRSDCLGVYGIARDLAATGIGKLKLLEIPKYDGKFQSPIEIKTEDKKACPMLISRYFRGVKNQPSPEWMQKTLKAIGMKPISALVDITNYISYEFGRPLHVYDAKKLSGNLCVCKTRSAEKITALDDKNYQLDEGTLVIADGKFPVAIAGVIGGKDSGCGDDTTDALLEVALFDQVEVAKTGRKLQINTDSRYRFERGVDTGFLEKAAEIATKYVIEICGGEASELVIYGEPPAKNLEIIFDPKVIKSLGNIDLPADRSLEILESLGFKTARSGNKYAVTPPTWRHDISCEADLVEEVLRINGYDNIPETPMPTGDSAKLLPTQLLSKNIRKKLVECGLKEVTTFSFMHHKKALEFTEIQDDLRLQNPISAELDYMRPSILPNLLKATANNISRGIHNLGFFEIGPVFGGNYKDMQTTVATGIRVGHDVERNPYSQSRPVDLFDAKADLFASVAESIKPDSLKLSRNTPEYYHPGKSGAVSLGKSVIGYFGEVHPKILQNYEVDSVVAGFELFIENLPVKRIGNSSNSSNSKGNFKFSNLQKVERDFAFLLNNEITAEQVIKTAKKSDESLIEAVNIFDVYHGKNIPENKKSVAFSITLQPKEETLKSEEIQVLSNKIVENISNELGGELRG